MNLIYRSPIDFKTKVIQCDDSLVALRKCIIHKENLSENFDIDIYHNGKILKSDFNNESHVDDVFLQIVLPLKGGKGGFGSMLRAIGAQIEKTTNREACRDLSGRRLRDVNEEKRIKDWIKKQADKKEENEKKKKEKLKRLAEMTVPATCQYDDDEFEKARAEIPDIVEDSIQYGLKQQKQQQEKDDKATTSGTTSMKRKVDEIDDEDSTQEDKTKKAQSSKQAKSDDKLNKKNVLWLGFDPDSDESDTDNDDDDDDDATGTKRCDKAAVIGK